MEKFNFCNPDGTEITFLKEQGDDICLDSELPKRFYFETHILEDGNMAIEVKTTDAAVFYDGLRGDILLTDKKLVVPAKAFKKGDVVGCLIWLYTLKRNDQHYSSISFSINGETTSSIGNHTLKGEVITPMVYSDPQKNLVDVNCGDKPFNFNPGNINAKDK